MYRAMLGRSLRTARGLADALDGPASIGSLAWSVEGSGVWSAQQQFNLTRLHAYGSSTPSQQHKQHKQHHEVDQQHETASSRSPPAAADQPSTSAAAAPQRQAVPPGHTDFRLRELVMFYTCARCETRSAKAFSKQSYEYGVVIVECPGCNARHLIADNLGWFGQKGTVEDFAAERGGMVVRKLADGTVELTPQEVLGASSTAAATAAELAAAGTAGSGQQEQASRATTAATGGGGTS